jgi:hypothetical protein
MKYKFSVFCLIAIVCCSFHLTASTPPDPSPAPQRGIAYGNVLKPGWSAIYQWYKGAWGRTSYRRVIVDIRIAPVSAKVFFANGSSRNLYNIAIINNVNTTAGGLNTWKIARRNRKDTLLLRNGKIVHAIIRGYNNHYYVFKGRAPIHRDSISIVYPNPSVPLRARL